MINGVKYHRYKIMSAGCLYLLIWTFCYQRLFVHVSWSNNGLVVTHSENKVDKNPSYVIRFVENRNYSKVRPHRVWNTVQKLEVHSRYNKIMHAGYLVASWRSYGNREDVPWPLSIGGALWSLFSLPSLWFSIEICMLWLHCHIAISRPCFQGQNPIGLVIPHVSN